VNRKFELTIHDFYLQQIIKKEKCSKLLPFTKSKATTSGSGFGYPTKGKSGKQTKIYQAQELKS